MTDNFGGYGQSKYGKLSSLISLPCSLHEFMHLLNMDKRTDPQVPSPSLPVYTGHGPGVCLLVRFSTSHAIMEGSYTSTVGAFILGVPKIFFINLLSVKKNGIS